LKNFDLVRFGDYLFLVDLMDLIPLQVPSAENIIPLETGSKFRAVVEIQAELKIKDVDSRPKPSDKGIQILGNAIASQPTEKKSPDSSANDAMLILLHEKLQRNIYLLGKATFMIGRSRGADIRLPSQSISPDHASIVREGKDLVLHDNGSIQGSRVNGIPVSRAVLHHRDLVRFGEYLFIVQIKDQPIRSLEPSLSKKQSASKRLKKQSKAVSIKLPKKSKVLDSKNSPRISQSISLLLTEPVDTPLTSSLVEGAGVKIKDARREHKTPFIAIETFRYFFKKSLLRTLGAILILILFMPSLYLIPLSDRESLVTSDLFHELPGGSYFKSFLTPVRTALSWQTRIDKFTTSSAQIVVPQGYRITGILHFDKIPTSPFQLQTRLFSTRSPTSAPIEKTITIDAKAPSIQLFSRFLDKGTYRLEWNLADRESPVQNSAIATIKYSW
jgi:pSer/pThr/pTyr-binding forkhead associated (FHA) protein